jgi:hypothetical protein
MYQLVDSLFYLYMYMYIYMHTYVHIIYIYIYVYIYIYICILSFFSPLHIHKLFMYIGLLTGCYQSVPLSVICSNLFTLSQSENTGKLCVPNQSSTHVKDFTCDSRTHTASAHTQTQTHTHIYTMIYTHRHTHMHIYMCIHTKI